QVVDIHTEFTRINRIQRVFHVDERGDSSALLGLCNNLQRDCRFTGGFRSENFVDPAAWEPAYPECRIERDGTGGDRSDGDDRVLRSQAQDRTLAELFFDLAKGGF